MKKLSKIKTSNYRFWYNEWVKANAKGKVLNVGKSRHWSYGFPTLDINPSMKPTVVGDILNAPFKGEAFDVVLCNGMYEFVADQQRMIDEVLRVAKKKAIFGFVGKNYKPYRKPWHCYEFKEGIPDHTMHHFGNEYHFIICKK